MDYPILEGGSRQRQWTQEFLGLDRRPRTNDGAFADTENLTGDQWPVVRTRDKRGTVAELDSPKALQNLNGLSWVDGTTLYYKGVAVKTGLSSGQKQLITFGAYLIVLPDGVYYNTVDSTDQGSVNRLYQSPAGQNVTFSPCTMDGIDFPTGSWTASDTPPANPSSGDYWINTSSKPHGLYQYSGLTEDWVGIVSVFIKIAADGIGEGLNVEDAVTVSGISVPTAGTKKDQLEILNETHVIQAVDDDYIVVIGIVDEVYTYSGRIRADRQMPELDFVFECNNRLWGCRYGKQNGETVNRLYATALGDFKNWRKFYGTSQDSYYVNVGTEGPFTGGIAHRGYPYFFKQNCVHKIYGDRPSNFEMQTTLCDGVKLGCERTLTSANGVLYYISNHGPVYFESMPALCGEALNRRDLENGAAGYSGGEWYLSAQEPDGTWSLYVYDTARGIWYRQDNSRALSFAAFGDELYMLDVSGKLLSMHGRAGDAETGRIAWRLESAVMGLETPDHKYISRFTIRTRLEDDGECAISMQYDQDGIWHYQGMLHAAGKTRTYLMPIVPRRCETAQIRLEGKGKFTLFGIARDLTPGSDANNREARA